MSAYEDAQKQAIDAITDLTSQCAAAVKRAEDAEDRAEDAERDAAELREKVETLKEQIADFEREDSDTRVKRDAEDLAREAEHERIADIVTDHERARGVYRENIPLWERVKAALSDASATPDGVDHRKAYADLEAAIVPELERLEGLAGMLRGIVSEENAKARVALIASARQRLAENA